MLTHYTTEFSLTFAVASVVVPAGTAALAGVGWSHKPDWHSGSLGLIAHKRPQLREGPIVVSCSLLWPFNPRPLRNAAQVFQRNRPLRAFGFSNQPLADLVVGILL